MMSPLEHLPHTVFPPEPHQLLEQQDHLYSSNNNNNNNELDSAATAGQVSHINFLYNFLSYFLVLFVTNFLLFSALIESYFVLTQRCG